MRLTNGIFELSRAHHEHVVTAGELPRFASASREHAKGLFLDAARAIYRGRTRAMDHSAEEGPAAAIQRLLEQHHDLLATPLFSEPRLTVASYYGFFPAEPKHFAKRIWHDPAPYGAGYVSDYGKGTTTHTNDRRRPARASRTHPPDSRAAGARGTVSEASRALMASHSAFVRQKRPHSTSTRAAPWREVAHRFLPEASGTGD
jgi:hypothetical protein